MVAHAIKASLADAVSSKALESLCPSVLGSTARWSAGARARLLCAFQAVLTSETGRSTNHVAELPVEKNGFNKCLRAHVKHFAVAAAADPTPNPTAGPSSDQDDPELTAAAGRAAAWARHSKLRSQAVDELRAQKRQRVESGLHGRLAKGAAATVIDKLVVDHGWVNPGRAGRQATGRPISPKALRELANDPRFDPNDPPTLGRCRILPPEIEVAIEQRCADAVAAAEPESAASLAASLSAILDNSALMSKFKHESVSPAHVRQLVERFPSMELNITQEMESRRWDWCTHANFEIWFRIWEDLLIEKGIAVPNLGCPDVAKDFAELIVVLKPTMVAWSDESHLRLNKSVSTNQHSQRIVAKTAGTKFGRRKAGKKVATKVATRLRGPSTYTGHITICVPVLLSGDVGPPLIILEAAKMDDRWDGAQTDPDFWTWNVNGRPVTALFVASKSGGMTPEIWKLYHEQIIYKMLPTSATNWGVHGYDGDFSHVSADVWEDMTTHHVAGQCPPPNTTHHTQIHDTGMMHSSMQTTHFPDAKAWRSRELKRMGVHRSLDLTDLPHILKRMWWRCYTRPQCISSVAAAGVYPPTRKPLFAEEILATKLAVPKQFKEITVADIKFKHDQAKLAAERLNPETMTDAAMVAAAEELARQLAGSRWGSAKFWKQNTSDPDAVFMCRVYEYGVKRCGNFDMNFDDVFCCFFVERQSQPCNNPFPPPPSAPTQKQGPESRRIGQGRGEQSCQCGEKEGAAG